MIYLLFICHRHLLQGVGSTDKVGILTTIIHLSIMPQESMYWSSLGCQVLAKDTGVKLRLSWVGCGLQVSPPPIIQRRTVCFHPYQFQEAIQQGSCSVGSYLCYVTTLARVQWCLSSIGWAQHHQWATVFQSASFCYFTDMELNPRVWVDFKVSDSRPQNWSSNSWPQWFISLLITLVSEENQ